MKLKLMSLCLVALGVAVLPGCGWDGHFSILGYTTQPMYDPGIRSVRVPIFKNLTFRRGLEFSLTQEVIDQIHAKTPYMVKQSSDDADTELIGTIVSRGKQMINFNQLAENREAELTLTVELVWRDLRTGRCGEILSRPQPKQGEPLPPPVPSGQTAPPVLVQAIGHFVPEVGGTNQTGEQEMIHNLAVQIVSMMEKPW